mgnify:CR=1 FL=1
MRLRRVHAAFLRRDDVVEAQGRAFMRLIGQEGFELRQVRIEQREHMADLALALRRQLFDAANGQRRNGDRLHRSGPLHDG